VGLTVLEPLAALDLEDYNFSNLPEEYEEKLTNFQKFVILLKRNMDTFFLKL
jgi:hypothetical protein